jgi:hypothetical protein
MTRSSTITPVFIAARNNVTVKNCYFWKIMLKSFLLQAFPHKVVAQKANRCYLTPPSIVENMYCTVRFDQGQRLPCLVDVVPPTLSPSPHPAQPHHTSRVSVESLFLLQWYHFLLIIVQTSSSLFCLTRKWAVAWIQSSLEPVCGGGGDAGPALPNL